MLVGIIQLIECVDRTKGRPVYSTWDIHHLSSDSVTPGFGALGFRSELIYTTDSKFSGLWNWTELHHLFSGFICFVDSRLWNFSPSIIVWEIYIYLHSIIYVLSQFTQSHPMLCNPMDRSPPGFSVHGILQARILEWVGCHSLFQGIFPTQGLNLGFPHFGQNLYHPEPLGLYVNWEWSMAL